MKYVCDICLEEREADSAFSPTYPPWSEKLDNPYTLWECRPCFDKRHDAHDHLKVSCKVCGATVEDYTDNPNEHKLIRMTPGNFICDTSECQGKWLLPEAQRVGLLPQGEMTSTASALEKAKEGRVLVWKPRKVNW